LTSLTFASSSAQVRGSGTVNGGGNYGFLLAAADGDAINNNGLIEVRMKIWDASKGEAKGVIYDTQPGAADSAVPTTPLGQATGSPPSPAPPGGGGNGEAKPPMPLLIDSLFASELEVPARANLMAIPATSREQEASLVKPRLAAGTSMAGRRALEDVIGNYEWSPLAAGLAD
jgi:hypothetical protein